MFTAASVPTPTPTPIPTPTPTPPPTRTEAFERVRLLAFSIAHEYARGRPWLLDDLTSDALLTAWQCAGRLDPARLSTFPGYVALAVRRECYRRVTADSQRAARFQQVDDQTEETFDGLEGMATDRGPSPGAQGVADELLSRLPPRARAIVVRRLAGATFRDLATAEKITASGVRDYLMPTARRVWQET